jgi:hypothetical protein
MQGRALRPPVSGGAKPRPCAAGIFNNGAEMITNAIVWYCYPEAGENVAGSIFERM